MVGGEVPEGLAPCSSTGGLELLLGPCQCSHALLHLSGVVAAHLLGGTHLQGVPQLATWTAQHSTACTRSTAQQGRDCSDPSFPAMLRLFRSERMMSGERISKIVIYMYTHPVHITTA